MKFIRMSVEELKKLETVESIRAGRLKQVEAADRLGVSDRSVRNWLMSFTKKGAVGLTHGNRGKKSAHRIPVRERKRIVSIIRKRYQDFGPTFACEKLAELHGIHRDSTTIRDIMVAEKLWIPRAQRKRARSIHRQWREPRSHRGDLVQFDGSYHDWFEGRGERKEFCLLSAIDDATGEILHASFCQDEGTIPVMAFWQEYASIHGLPKDVYLDRFSTYKMTQKVAVENPDLKTQLQRAMNTLGVGLIFAHSPQAKGRVERSFKTLQDRLVKEMRLKDIKTKEEGNRFLKEMFLPSFNRKFRRTPKEQQDFHRPISQKERNGLKNVLCRLEERVVQNDFTVSFKGQWYQILATAGLAVRPKEDVLVREHTDQSVSFTIRHKQVNTKPISKREVAKHPSIKDPVPTLVPI
jgi:transposase